MNICNMSDREQSRSLDDLDVVDTVTDVNLNLNQTQNEASYNPSRQSISRTSLHVSVHRTNISPTRVQEGNDELEGLDVEAYDRQSYEKSVFDQVDKAITEADVASRQKGRELNQSTNINDLMRVIHEQDDSNEANDSFEVQDRDEQVLQLTRLERLNRTIKKEPIEDEGANDSIRQMPKIPRLPKSTDCDINLTNNHSGPSTSFVEQSTFKLEPELDLEIGELDLDLDDSSISEYKPSDDDSSASEEEFNENVEYENDSELDNNVDEEVEIEDKGKKIKDDGDFKSYAARVKAFTRARAKLRLDNILDDGTEYKKLDEMVTIEGDLQVPVDVWNQLYEHQKTGVRWLWELHQLGTGGILGDEMGLGKTIQMIGFLTALKTSNVVSSHKGYKGLGPTVLVCPATVMHQWLLEFRKWWPPFRVAILHSTGTFTGDRKQLVNVIHKSNGILICSYPGVIIYQDYLHALDWHYVILDEGHKIRNPDAQVTLACKRFRTPHRIILSGSPVQNNLKELWSIFDFIYPGKLGTLPVFMGQFGTPITQGGYANATDIQVQIAYKCACVLRDTIRPFLLRRTKAEVNNKLRLPDRSEQVLFCKLTDKQRKLYQAYLESPTVRDIKLGLCQIFVGLIQLRKICNHPDLFDTSDCLKQIKQNNRSETKPNHLEFFSADETFGHCQKSGKMMVVDALLKLWKKQNHKVLLFTQSRQMLKIFINYLKERGYRYSVMDGSTPIGLRHSLIEEFNNTEEIFIFLLTTRVGGVGVNLVGANRIIIYDPDWNPSTDIQARERAWRIGQQRHVIIYRLLTAGTIEEKIYHRQVFKLYLTNRVLRDAKQKRFFKTNDLHELFTLGLDDKNIETKALFDDDLQINEDSIKTKRKSKSKSKKRRRSVSLIENGREIETTVMISEQKRLEMRERAKRLSQMIALQYGSKSTSVVENEPDNGQSDPRVALVKTEHVDVNDPAPFSPTEPVPYCPIKQEPRAKEAIQLNSSRSKKKSVEYLVKQDVYRPGRSESKSDSRNKREDYILERLFKKSNIFGALKHDKIETDSTSDYKIVESEAEKVARDAIRALRESRRMCLDSTSGIPNWTGRNGQVAAQPRLVPKNKARAQQMMNAAVPSSSNESILDSIKKRNQTNPVRLHNNLGASLDSDDEDRNKDFEGRAKGTGAEDMADKIRELIMYKCANNGEAQTDELLEFFKSNYAPDKTAVFKALLCKMCDFQRRSDKGFWKIRSEYRDI